MNILPRRTLPLLATLALCCGLNIRAQAQWHQTEDVSYSWTSGNGVAGVTATHTPTTATLSFSNPFSTNGAYEIDSYRRYNSWQASGPPGPGPFSAAVLQNSLGVGFDIFTNAPGSATFSASGQVGTGTYLQFGASYPSSSTGHDYLSQETHDYALNGSNYAHVAIKLTSASAVYNGCTGTQYGDASAKFPDDAF